MSKRHYHLVIGTPGYMPDVNMIFPTIKAATDALKNGVAMAREAGFVCFGNLREGLFECYYKKGGDAITTLPQRLEIVACNEDCLEHPEDFD